MKNNINISLLGVLLVAVCNAQTVTKKLPLNKNTPKPKAYNFVVKVNPLSILSGPISFLGIIPITSEYGLKGELKVHKNQSLQLGVSYLGPNMFLSLKDSTNSRVVAKISGYRVQAAYKIYISKKLDSPQGTYLGPNVSYAAATLSSIDNPENYIQAVFMNAALIFGYQKVNKYGFAFDLYVGVGYKSNKWYVNDPAKSTFKEETLKQLVPLKTILGISVGYAF